MFQILIQLRYDTGISVDCEEIFRYSHRTKYSNLSWESIKSKEPES